MKFALDTNVLAYAAGVDDAARRDRAREIVALIGPERICLPQQVAGEFYNVLRRKGRKTPDVARNLVDQWIDLIGLSFTSGSTFDHALGLATDHSFHIWDAIILATAADQRCVLLLSEDMHEGFVHRGTTISNPFRTELHPMLASLSRSVL